ncbi:pilus assembly protein TadG-related protein [Hyphomicrobium sp.]|uniref:pilus assembly protein TadG-related protein n=1 Tax=Hyphomicrobium sp. TaxID=82 RepID=UPI002FE13CA9
MTCRSLLLRARSAREGSVAVLMALFLGVSIVLCALAVDVGSLYLERRTAQGAADLAALAAASDLDRAEQAARATLTANGFGDVSLAVTKGRYEGDAALAPSERFAPGKTPFNAVRLDVATGGQLHFAKSFMAEPQIAVSALGAADAQATFSIGSRLAQLNGGAVNALFGSLLGGNVSLSAMDYQALFDANVSIARFLSELAVETGVTAGTYGELLSGEVAVGAVLRAVVEAARADGENRAAEVVSTLLSEVTANATVSLDTLVDLGPLANAQIGQPNAGLGADVGVMSLISALASAANGGNQVAVNLGGAIPGLLSLKLDLAVGERMQRSGWVTVGQPGATLETAQTRLRLVAEVGGTGVLAGARVRLPIYIEVAAAEARLKALTCTGAEAANREAVIEARPAAVKAWIGDVTAGGLSSFGTSVPVSDASVVQAPLISVSASAFAQMTNVAATELSFSQGDIDTHVIKTAKVRDHLSSLVSSLLQTARLNANVAGLGLNVSAIKVLVLSLLSPVVAALDPVVESLLEAVGGSRGEVDVEVNGLRCGGAVLAG